MPIGGQQALVVGVGRGQGGDPCRQPVLGQGLFEIRMGVVGRRTDGPILGKLGRREPLAMLGRGIGDDGLGQLFAALGFETLVARGQQGQPLVFAERARLETLVRRGAQR